MKFLSVVLGVILIITALPLEILFHYCFLDKIASINEGYGISIFLAECIIFFCQVIFGAILIAFSFKE